MYSKIIYCKVNSVNMDLFRNMGSYTDLFQSDTGPRSIAHSVRRYAYGREVCRYLYSVAWTCSNLLKFHSGNGVDALPMAFPGLFRLGFCPCPAYTFSHR